MTTTTNPRSETAETQKPQPSGPKSIGIHASKMGNSGSENEDYSLKASGSRAQMRTLRKRTITW